MQLLNGRGRRSTVAKRSGTDRQTKHVPHFDLRNGDLQPLLSTLGVVVRRILVISRVSGIALADEHRSDNRDGVGPKNVAGLTG